MNTNEKWRDNRAQRESDKFEMKNRVTRHNECWKTGAMSSENEEQYNLFFNNEMDTFMHIHQAIKFTLIPQHHWHPADIDLMTPQALSLALTD